MGAAADGRQDGRWVRRIALAVALALVGVLATTHPALASGTLTVQIAGAGHVSGSGIDCSRAVNASGTTGTCSQSIPDEVDCDPERKPPCITFPGEAFITASDVVPTGFTFDHWSGACTGTAPSCDIVMNGGKSVTATFRDAQKPSVALSKPGAGAVAGTIPLEAGASDNAGVARVDFSVRGVVRKSVTSAPFTATFDTTTLPDGPAAVTASAVDTSGNSTTTAAVNVTIDNTRPTLAVNGPTNQAFGPGSTQTWALAPADATSGVALVRCSVVPTGQAASFAPCSGGNASHSVSNKPEGSYTLTVRVTDGAGNTFDQVRTFSIDATAPETSITSGIADGGTTTATSLTWGISSSEAGSTFECRVYPAALTPGAFATCSSATTHTASGFAPGTYAFEVRATDAVGNVDATPAKRTFTVTAPNTGGGGGGSPRGVGGQPVQQIVVTLGFNFRSSARRTILSSLVVKNVPAGATVTATCKKGCARKALVKRNASGRVSLKGFVKRPLSVNTRITVIVSKPGASSAVKVLKIRSRKAPLVSTLCQAPGAPKPKAC